MGCLFRYPLFDEDFAPARGVAGREGINLIPSIGDGKVLVPTRYENYHLTAFTFNGVFTP
jgi:hypothetical protein